MAGYVCTVAGGKGGVGKTTTAVNLAAALESRGHDVVVVDADLGMANLGAMLEVDVVDSIHEVLSGSSAVSEALTDVQGGITIVPGEQSLEAFADADPSNLKKVITTLRNAYDVVLIDTGAGLSHETTVPLGLANGILLLTTPDDVAVGDAVKTAELADRVGGDVLGVALNRATAETDVEGIAEQFHSDLLAVVPDAIEATETEPLVLNNPDSAPADAYRQLADLLEPVFIDGRQLGDVDVVLERDWFLDESPEPDTDTDETADVDDDDDEEDGRFSGIFN